MLHMLDPKDSHNALERSNSTELLGIYRTPSLTQTDRTDTETHDD